MTVCRRGSIPAWGARALAVGAGQPSGAKRWHPVQEASLLLAAQHVRPQDCHGQGAHQGGDGQDGGCVRWPGAEGGCGARPDGQPLEAGGRMVWTPAMSTARDGSRCAASACRSLFVNRWASHARRVPCSSSARARRPRGAGPTLLACATPASPCQSGWTASPAACRYDATGWQPCAVLGLLLPLANPAGHSAAVLPGIPHSQ